MPSLPVMISIIGYVMFAKPKFRHIYSDIGTKDTFKKSITKHTFEEGITKHTFGETYF